MAKNNLAREKNMIDFAPRQHHSSVEVPEEHRGVLISLLNARLFDSLDVASQVKYAHWNVRGIHFYQLHLLFDEIAEHIEGHIDDIAERIGALGGVAHGTVREAAKHSGVPEYNLDAVEGDEHLKALVHNIGHHANTIREGIDEADRMRDRDTADLFTQVSRELDKDLWFLESHLVGKIK
ncbi:MAG TPA: DNA starvation/stationary phase protection protein Dps [Candidatus Acidoferrales bacterium]|nr:DNA starvation/stationary phase protection protein Dps [Candidatus Acidoferrales bacterium]